MPTSRAWCVGETLGTFLLVFFGCGSVAASVLTGAQVGVFQVAIVWGIGIAAAIHLTGGLSGAHLNPAVTVALATWRGFGWRRVPGYILCQFLGALMASCAIFVLFHGFLSAFEASHHIVRGAPGSEATAMIFGEFYPNPGGRPLDPNAVPTVTMVTAFLAEFLGTAILMLVVLGVSDTRNPSRPSELAPAMIGLTVTLLISLLGPVTMAALNPARDVAPRIFSSLAGWGRVPFTVNGWGWLTVYVVAPVAGAVSSGAVHTWLLRPGYLGPVRAIGDPLDRAHEEHVG